MASEQQTNGVATNGTPDFTVKAGLAQMLKGGVIMDVVNAEQVRHAENSLQTPVWRFDNGGN